MTINVRNKGSSGEREICHILQDSLGLPVTRNITQVRDGGADIKLPPYSIEVKRRKSFKTLYSFMDQAQKGCKEREIPIVVLRGDREEWFAVLPLNELIKLIREEVVNAS